MLCKLPVLYRFLSYHDHQGGVNSPVIDLTALSQEGVGAEAGVEDGFADAAIYEAEVGGELVGGFVVFGDGVEG